MSAREYLKEMAINFFMIVTLIDLAMLVMGLGLEKDVRFGYEAFLMPLLYGFLGVLPSFVMYSRKELSVRQMMVRKVMHLLLLELVLLAFMYVNGIRNGVTLFAIGVSIIIICIAVYGLSWILEVKKSDEITQELKQYQDRKKNELN